MEKISPQFNYLRLKMVYVYEEGNITTEITYQPLLKSTVIEKLKSVIREFQPNILLREQLAPLNSGGVRTTMIVNPLKPSAKEVVTFHVRVDQFVSVNQFEIIRGRLRKAFNKYKEITSTLVSLEEQKKYYNERARQRRKEKTFKKLSKN